MKLLSICIFTLSILLISNICDAQVNTNNQLEIDNSIVKDAAYYSDSNFVGTFQIIHRSKDFELLTYEIYYLIEARRADYDVVMWDISDNTTIRIFPKSLVYPPTNFRIQETEILETH